MRRSSLRTVLAVDPYDRHTPGRDRHGLCPEERPVGAPRPALWRKERPFAAYCPASCSKQRPCHCRSRALLPFERPVRLGMDVILAANQVIAEGRAYKWAKAVSRTPNARKNGATGSRERGTPLIFGVLYPTAGQKRVDRGPSPHQHHPGRRAAAREIVIRQRRADGVDQHPHTGASRSPPGVDDPRCRGDQHHRRERARQQGPTSTRRPARIAQTGRDVTHRVAIGRDTTRGLPRVSLAAIEKPCGTNPSRSRKLDGIRCQRRSSKPERNTASSSCISCTWGENLVGRCFPSRSSGRTRVTPRHQTKGGRSQICFDRLRRHACHRAAGCVSDRYSLEPVLLPGSPDYPIAFRARDSNLARRAVSCRYRGHWRRSGWTAGTTSKAKRAKGSTARPAKPRSGNTIASEVIPQRFTSRKRIRATRELRAASSPYQGLPSVVAFAAEDLLERAGRHQALTPLE